MRTGIRQKVLRHVWLAGLCTIFLFVLAVGCSPPTTGGPDGSAAEGAAGGDSGTVTENSSTEQPASSCKSHDDCKDPAQPWCLNGQCSNEKSCQGDGDCPDPKKSKCVNGICDAVAPECKSDNDCQDPAKPLCKNNQCESKPVECSSDLDCSNPAKPLCQNGSCVPKKDECSQNSDCSVPTPVCVKGKCTAKPGCRSDAECKAPTPLCKNGKCEPSGSECFQNGDCKDAAKPRCVKNKCEPAECKVNADCKDPAKSKCDSFVCSPCGVNADCATGLICNNGNCEKKAGCTDEECKKADPSKPVCLRGQCVPIPPECKSNTDCKAPKPICSKNKCVPAPPECQKNNDCNKDPKKPLCVKNRCVPRTGCKSDADCRDASKKRCELSSGTCYACVVDTHCATWQLCDIRNHSCVPKPGSCGTNKDCTSSSAPVCVKNKCVSCSKDSECKALQACRNNLCVNVGCSNDAQCKPKLCNTTSKQCVDCTASSHCQAGQTCLNNKCVTTRCTSDRACKAPTPACLSGKCVECTDAKKHCPSGFKCTSNKCVNCTADKDCTTPNKAPPYASRTTYLCVSSKCRTGCRADTNCSLGFICDKTKLTCVAGCRSTSDCPNGQTCTNNKCSLTCNNNFDCDRRSNTHEICDTKASPRACVQCLSDSNCSARQYGTAFAAQRPKCDTTTKTCGCKKNSDCSTSSFTNSAGAVCDTKEKRCYACDPTLDPKNPDQHCRRGFLCNKSRQCVTGCRTNSDCSATTSTPICNTSNNKCVACTKDSDCKNGVCDKSNRCIECRKDTDCKDAKKTKCDTFSLTCYQPSEKGQCVACSKTSDCAKNHECRDVSVASGYKEKVCVKKCRKNSDCGQGFRCGSFAFPRLSNFCWPDYAGTARTCKGFIDMGKTCTNSQRDCGARQLRTDGTCSTLQGGVCVVLCNNNNNCPATYTCGCPSGYKPRSRFGGRVLDCVLISGNGSTARRCIR